MILLNVFCSHFLSWVNLVCSSVWGRTLINIPEGPSRTLVNITEGITVQLLSRDSPGYMYAPLKIIMPHNEQDSKTFLMILTLKSCIDLAYGHHMGSHRADHDLLYE